MAEFSSKIEVDFDPNYVSHVLQFKPRIYETPMGGWRLQIADEEFVLLTRRVLSDQYKFLQEIENSMSYSDRSALPNNIFELDLRLLDDLTYRYYTDLNPIQFVREVLPNLFNIYLLNNPADSEFPYIFDADVNLNFVILRQTSLLFSNDHKIGPIEYEIDRVLCYKW